MSLLKPAQMQTAYLKAGMLGFQGSGKTYTAKELAKGLARLSGKETPKVAMFDTEKGSDFLVRDFQAAGIQFDVAKSRTFVELIQFMKEVEKEGYDVAIIDSITHVWNELRESYEKRKRRSNGLLFQDWGPIKGEWRQFTDLFINTRLHTIVLGRAGYDYDTTEDESGKMQLTKAGTKMKAEGEFGYESDILMEMERVPNKDAKGWINRCTVLKDRTDTMNGKVIDYPKFEDFRSVIAALNIGGEHEGIDTTRNSQNMFDDPDHSYAELKKQRDIALEELQEVLTMNDLTGTAAATLKRRTELLMDVYGTSSKTALENMHPDKIRGGVAAIKTRFEPAQEGEETGELITAPQISKLFATLNGYNVTETAKQKAIIYGMAESLLGVKITSTKQLTKAQAKELIDKLEQSGGDALEIFAPAETAAAPVEPF